VRGRTEEEEEAEGEVKIGDREGNKSKIRRRRDTTNI
jgi:hypothetical protein